MSATVPGRLPSLAAAEDPARRLRSSRSQRADIETLSRIWRNPMGRFGVLVLLVLGLTALGAPWIAPFDPIEQHRGDELVPPAPPYLLGTDQLGRDLLSRIIHGTRISFAVGILAVTLGAAVGVATGLVAGYSGGMFDAVIMRSYDALLAFPAILLGIAVISVLGPSSLNVAYALAIAQMPIFARLTRASVLVERERDYVHAARCTGAGDRRIMGLHVLPNCLPPLLVQLSLAMGASVLAEAGLSFLGLGAQPPDPSWGSILNEARAYLREAPWYGFWPGVALLLMLLALNYLADAIRDAVDPRRVKV